MAYIKVKTRYIYGRMDPRLVTEVKSDKYNLHI